MTAAIDPAARPLTRGDANEDGIIDAAILARLEHTWAGRTDEQRSPAWVDRQMDKVHASLQAMSRGLADKPYCTGIHFTLADIALGAYARRWFGVEGIVKPQFQHLERWFAQFASRPGFVQFVGVPMS